MKTAVEWYNEQLNLYGDMAFNKEISLGQYHIKKQELLEQANKMFEEQICKFASDYVETQCSASFEGSVSVDMTTEQYYKETFKSE
jgi:hypothetical protein